VRTPKILLLSLVLAAASLVVAQERVKKKEAAGFPTTHQALGKAWEAGEYGRCMSLARDLLALITNKRTEVVLAAFPPAPEGWEVVPEANDDSASNPFLAAMAASVGNVIQRRYREVQGGGTLELSVNADSPLAQMLQMSIANPQLLGPDAEAVKYGPHSAVLRKEGSGWSLQLLLGENLVEAKLQGGDDDFLLGVVDQEAVDALEKALSK